MALFGKKKEVKADAVEEVKTKKVASKTTKSKTTKKETKTAKAEVSADVKSESTVSEKTNFSYRITEKATNLSNKNVYVLNVPKETNKTELKKTLQTKYKVTVLGINIINSPKKTKNYKGRPGVRGGGKKAYITLKAGDSIVL